MGLKVNLKRFTYYVFLSTHFFQYTKQVFCHVFNRRSIWNKSYTMKELFIHFLKQYLKKLCKSHDVLKSNKVTVRMNPKEIYKLFKIQNSSFFLPWVPKRWSKLIYYLIETRRYRCICNFPLISMQVLEYIFLWSICICNLNIKNK